MKYGEEKRPLVCMMTQSTCYRGTRRFTPKGILWHCTGANNPWLKRYVQPDDNATDRTYLIKGTPELLRNPVGKYYLGCLQPLCPYQ